MVKIVNVWEKKCSCKYFDIQQLPCTYALTVYRHIHLSHNSLCSHYYRTDILVAAYAEVIHPLGNDVDWEVPF